MKFGMLIGNKHLRPAFFPNYVPLIDVLLLLPLKVLRCDLEVAPLFCLFSSPTPAWLGNYILSNRYTLCQALCQVLLPSLFYLISITP